MRPWILNAFILDLCIIQSIIQFGFTRRQRAIPAVPYPDGSPAHPEEKSTPDEEPHERWQVNQNGFDTNPLMNSIDFIWSKQTVAAGDTAVLHCSFDAIFSQLRNGNIDWVKESPGGKPDKATLLATGKKVVLEDRRYRVYRPHNSALSVLIIRRAKKKDGGIFKCNLSGSSTRHKYLILNVTESKIEAQTSPAKLKARMGKDVTMWCNATGYPRPVVYWTREDSNHKLPDGTYQFWGNGLQVRRLTEADTGIYACYLDNFVQPVVSYKFNLVVEDRPWHLDGYKMRFDSSQWYPHDSDDPKPVQGKSFLLMCETRGTPRPLPKIRWFKDTREIRNSRHFYIIEDKPEWRDGYTSSTLVIMKFVPRHQANYTCLASNHFRSKRIEFFINEYDVNQRKKKLQLGPIHNGNSIDNMPVIGHDPLLVGHHEDDFKAGLDLSEGPVREDTVKKDQGNSEDAAPTAAMDGSGNGQMGPNDDEDYDVGSGSGTDELDTEDESE